MTKPFYVYRILGEMGETVYIGKGYGRRLHHQKRRFMSDGEVMEWCSTDKQAFRRERELIAKHSPPLNRIAGGGGSVTRHKNRLPVWFTRQIKEIERVGSRRWVARELLKLDHSSVVTPGTIDMLRAASV